jgi:hypothetical protein
MKDKSTKTERFSVTDRGLLFEEVTTRTTLVPIRNLPLLLERFTAYSGMSMSDLVRAWGGDVHKITEELRRAQHAWQLTSDMLVIVEDFAFDDVFQADTRRGFDAAVKQFAKRGEKYSEKAARLFLEGIDAGLSWKPALARKRFKQAVKLWDTPWDD